MKQNQGSVSSVLRTVIHSDVWVPGTPIYTGSIVGLGSVIGRCIAKWLSAASQISELPTVLQRAHDLICVAKIKVMVLAWTILPSTFSLSHRAAWVISSPRFLQLPWAAVVFTAGCTFSC